MVAPLHLRTHAALCIGRLDEFRNRSYKGFEAQVESARPHSLKVVTKERVQWQPRKSGRRRTDGRKVVEMAKGEWLHTLTFANDNHIHAPIVSFRRRHGSLCMRERTTGPHVTISTHLNLTKQRTLPSTCIHLTLPSVPLPSSTCPTWRHPSMYTPIPRSHPNSSPPQEPKNELQLTYLISHSLTFNFPSPPPPPPPPPSNPSPASNPSSSPRGGTPARTSNPFFLSPGRRDMARGDVSGVRMRDRAGFEECAGDMRSGWVDWMEGRW